MNEPNRAANEGQAASPALPRAASGTTGEGRPALPPLPEGEGTERAAFAEGERTRVFEPKIIAYVCNWCTYLGADLAGTNRLEYPANVRIVRLPCTGRIDFNLIVKAFEVGADAVLVSGCHPGDCHYTAGNFHARRRWLLFRRLLEAIGIETRRIHFSWISAAEGRKFQQVVTEITETTRQMGPYLAYRQICEAG